ncbi:MAG TPA: response regulator transcription factor [Geobacteraceae bacterium]|nr:response regulator transcription factor [Geobacteraceae bacterium]
MAKHIVIIDDCRVTLAMLTDMLEQAGFRVTTAEDSVYSNHLIYNSSPPDLILLDVMLPHMSGDKKARKLKERKNSHDIPVLLISSKDETELVKLVASSGADGFLHKPFTADMLLDTVQAHLAA